MIDVWQPDGHLKHYCVQRTAGASSAYTPREPLISHCQPSTVMVLLTFNPRLDPGFLSMGLSENCSSAIQATKTMTNRYHYNRNADLRTVRMRRSNSAEDANAIIAMNAPSNYTSSLIGVSILISVPSSSSTSTYHDVRTTYDDP